MIFQSAISAPYFPTGFHNSIVLGTVQSFKTPLLPPISQLHGYGIEPRIPLIRRQKFLLQVYDALGVSYVPDEKLDKGIAQLETTIKHQPGYVTASKNCGDSSELTPSLQSSSKQASIRETKKRVFFLDVNPICYNGSTPSLHSFAQWVSLLFSEVSLKDPVIAVIDGERGNEYRQQLLPSYKIHRRKTSTQYSVSKQYPRGSVWRSHHIVIDLLRKLNVPVVKVEGYEADDVVATLVNQVLKAGYRAVIASPDKDFKQLISEDVQIVMPIPELNRWSFYTLKHYIAQYNCDPSSDLSLRCILGDESDGVPGIQHVVPAFGRKTALKLLQKHGSLENLLNVAAVRTVGKQYAQDALTKYADYLRRNYQVLSLKRDVDIHLQEEWVSERETCNDSMILSDFLRLSEENHKFNRQNRSHSSNG